MGTAALWGAVAASSLVIGALLALVREWPAKLVALVLAFGAGALISAVSFELFEDGVEVGGGTAVGIGLAVGALTYFVLDSRVEGRRGSDPASALALGAFLDGIPEQLVLGLGIAVGGEVGVGLIAAIFVSNLPEAIGSASQMRRHGRDTATIMRLWSAVAVVCALSSLIGYALADNLSDELQGGLNGFAAGALLVMLTDSMIPEARKGGRTAGLATVFGFALAAGLSTVS
jgi:zinc transporter, ZIP family